jgi:exosortase A
MMKSEFFDNYRTLILIFIMTLAVPALMYQTTLDMANVWWVNETFTHGFLVFPIALWLIWDKRRHLTYLQPSPEPLFYIVTLLGLCIWFISALIDIKGLMQLSMIGIILSLALATLGRTIFLYLLFPLLYLLFAVPIGQGLIPPLMELTAHNTVFLVKLTGVPIYQEGLHFVLPSGEWSVVEECSGVRYLIATLTLGVAYAYLTYASLRKRLIFIGIAIVVPIVANSLRAFIIVMLGHISGMKLAVGADHLLYGWVFFGIVIFILFYIGSYWRDSKRDFDDRAPAPCGSKNSWALHYLLASLVVITLFQFSFDRMKQASAEYTPPTGIEFEINDPTVWKHQPGTTPYWQPVIHNPDISISSIYMREKDSVQLDIGYYFIQRDGHETVSSANKLVNSVGDDKWKLISSSKLDTGRFVVKEAIVLGGNKRILTWHWYRMGEFQTSSPYWAKLYEAYLQIFSDRNDGAYIVLSTSLDEDKGTSRQAMSEFFHDSVDIINAQLDSLQQQAGDSE